MDMGMNDNGELVYILKPYIYKTVIDNSRFSIVRKELKNKIESEVIYKKEDKDTEKIKKKYVYIRG